MPETVQTIDKGHIAEKVLDDFRPTERPKWAEIARFSFRVSVDTNKPLNLVIHLSKSKVRIRVNNPRRKLPSNTGETVLRQKPQG